MRWADRGKSVAPAHGLERHAVREHDVGVKPLARRTGRGPARCRPAMAILPGVRGRAGELGSVGRCNFGPQ